MTEKPNEYYTVDDRDVSRDTYSYVWNFCSICCNKLK